jgi:Mn2+/Fe2+ NRAMP family transporter
VANGMVAPVVLVLIVLLSSSKKVMGNYKNHPLTTGIGWIVTGLMIMAGIATIVSLSH